MHRAYIHCSGRRIWIHWEPYAVESRRKHHHLLATISKTYVNDFSLSKQDYEGHEEDAPTIMRSYEADYRDESAV